MSRQITGILHERARPAGARPQLFSGTVSFDKLLKTSEYRTIHAQTHAGDAHLFGRQPGVREIRTVWAESRQISVLGPMVAVSMETKI